MYTDKLPPQDVDAEEAVLGSLLIDGGAISKVASFLKPAHFAHERNNWCYQACLSLSDRSEAIDQVTVARELERIGRLEGAGGRAYLAHLAAVVPTSFHVEHYGRIVYRTATLRELIRAAGQIAEIGYQDTPDVDTALSRAEDILYKLRLGQSTRDFTHIRDVIESFLGEVAVPSDAQAEGQGAIATGFIDLDKLLGGLQRSDLIILAARPGLGKSSLALNIARNAARSDNVRVAIFSLEMGKEQVVQRFISSEARVDMQRLRLARLTDEERNRVTDAMGILSDMSIWIDDSPSPSLAEMRSKARRLHLEHPLGLVIVDYLQLMEGSRFTDNRVQQVSEISRSLKGLARDLHVPVIAVSQLSRAVEARTDHTPQLADLRESGSIEQDADVVMFIYRPDLYVTEDAWSSRHPNEPFPRGIADIVIAKHRHGPTGRVQMYFREKLTRFENLASPHAAPA